MGLWKIVSLLELVDVFVFFGVWGVVYLVCIGCWCVVCCLCVGEVFVE